MKMLYDTRFLSVTGISRVVSMYRFQIDTLATKLGVRNIALLGSGLLLINYIGSIVAAFYLPQVIIVHSFAIGILIVLHAPQ